MMKLHHSSRLNNMKSVFRFEAEIVSWEIRKSARSRQQDKVHDNRFPFLNHSGEKSHKQFTRFSCRLHIHSWPLNSWCGPLFFGAFLVVRFSSAT